MEGFHQLLMYRHVKHAGKEKVSLHTLCTVAGHLVVYPIGLCSVLFLRSCEIDWSRLLTVVFFWHYFLRKRKAVCSRILRPPRHNIVISMRTSQFSIIAWDILECTWQAVGQFIEIEVDMNRPGTDVPQISKSPVTKHNRMLSIYSIIIPR
jgi:hypothetical protein